VSGASNLYNGVFVLLVSSGCFMGFVHSKHLRVTNFPDTSLNAAKKAIGVPFFTANLGKLRGRFL
jgi:hypothetical protein